MEQAHNCMGKGGRAMKQNRKPYDLHKVLVKLLEAARNKNKEALLGWVDNICQNTGVSYQKLVGMIGESVGEHVSQLKYRIIGDMQGRKDDTSFII
jgi:(p)ppGpp synthase/HD superfamily hydrolase